MLDVVLNAPPTHACGAASRRDFLRAGSLGLAGLLLPRLVQARSASATQDQGAERGSRAKSVLLVFLSGGFSHLDSFDPKPEAPEDVRGQYAAIDTVVPGLRISEKLPLMAGVMDRMTLVRSAAHTSDHHETAANWVLSGRYGSPFGDHPAVGAVAAHHTRSRGLVPPYVAIPDNPAFTWELGKSAFLGEHCESFKAGDPNQPNYRADADDLSSAARRAFAIDREPRKLRDRYGRTTAGQSLLLARRLVESGVRFVTVNHDGWDHHAGIFDHLNRKLPEFDRALSALVEDLDARGVLSETLLVVMSEFGRSHRINADGGRDHWAPAGSLLVAGAGVKRGLVLGATDRHGACAVERPVSPADMAATILDSLGINPRQHLPGPDGRPVAILDQGERVNELFG